MKKYLFIILVMVFSIYTFGCGKKQVSLEEQEPLSMETLSTLNTNVQSMPGAQATESKVGVTASIPASPVKLETLPPAGPYKPGALEIQTALKNAGFYAGEIDGKMGPLSRKAIEAFQKANGLQVDGKVGLKTWAVLSKYLNPVAEPAPETTRKKR
jgi:peptidoglycan hydrolase-like protein with peptidoglycan-binding domain